MNQWIKTYKQVPPLNIPVEILYVVPGEEPKVSVDRLVSYGDGSYRYLNGNYDDCTVLAWRKFEVDIENY